VYPAHSLNIWSLAIYALPVLFWDVQMYADGLWQLDRAAGALIDARRELVEGREAWGRQQRALQEEVQRLKQDMAVQEALQADKREVMQQVQRLAPGHVYVAYPNIRQTQAAAPIWHVLPVVGSPGTGKP
jgi:hypothetical protein